MTPAAFEPPNNWEVAVIRLPTVGANATATAAAASGAGVSDPRDLHQLQTPDLVVRLTGFELAGLEAQLEPLLTPAESQGFQLLLSFRVLQAAAPADELLFSFLPLQLRIIAPYPLVVECPATQFPGVAFNGTLGAPEGVVNYSPDASSPDSNSSLWQLLAFHQRLAGLQSCISGGWRGVEQDKSAVKVSSLTFDLGSPVLPGNSSVDSSKGEVGLGGEFLAVPIVVRIAVPPEGSAEASAGDFRLLTSPERFWNVELVSSQTGDTLAASAVVRTTPLSLLQPNATEATPKAVSDCVAGDFCAELRGLWTTEFPPASNLQLDRGRGIFVQLDLALPRAMTPSRRLPKDRLVDAFGSAGTPFPAESILGSYLQLTAPAPFQWSPSCAVSNSSNGDPASSWLAVCFGDSAYIYVDGIAGSTLSSAPVRASVTVFGASLTDATGNGKAFRLPLSRTWVVSLFDGGSLVAQRLVEAETADSLARLHTVEPPAAEAEPVQSSSANGSNETVPEIFGPLGLAVNESGPVSLGVDSVEICQGARLQDFLCPDGMFAYGLRAARLGGSDSWLDNLQLLCKEELDVGSNHTQWLVRRSSTGLAGDSQLLSRANEEAEGAQVDSIICEERSSSFMVGGRLQLWRRRRLMGLSAACTPRDQAERGIPWDKEGGAELRPATHRSQEDSGTNCTGLDPIANSDLWASCQGIADLRPCPTDTSSCCCNVGFLWSPPSKSCEVCAQSAATESPMRLCPPGMAVAGFQAAVIRQGGKAVAGAREVAAATVCAIQLVCRLLTVRHFAGNTRSSLQLVYAGVDQMEKEAGDGLPSFTGAQDIPWWQFAAAGAVLVLLLGGLWYCCCRRGSHVTFGDEGDVGRRILRPVGGLLWRRLFGPIYQRLIEPVVNRLAKTRLCKALGSVLRRIGGVIRRVVLCLCPCIRLCRRGAAKDLLKRDKSVSLGNFALGKAAELRKNIADGKLRSQLSGMLSARSKSSASVGGSDTEPQGRFAFLRGLSGRLLKRQPSSGAPSEEELPALEETQVDPDEEETPASEPSALEEEGEEEAEVSEAEASSSASSEEEEARGSESGSGS
ncbi:unnamed protein product [Polarella glacialis]|uniref:Uncharacterized protein n=1 Tax=Polarella glacialis TaxID=89957 RepID=A0A813DKN9_POLGL|nr:unnamed protein product [Polarella glacialis]